MPGPNERAALIELLKLEVADLDPSDPIEDLRAKANGITTIAGRLSVSVTAEILAKLEGTDPMPEHLFEARKLHRQQYTVDDLL